MSQVPCLHGHLANAAEVLAHKDHHILHCIFLVRQPLIQSVMNCFIKINCRHRNKKGEADVSVDWNHSFGNRNSADCREPGYAFFGIKWTGYIAVEVIDRIVKYVC